MPALGIHDGLTTPHVAKKTLLFALVVEAAFYYAGLYDLAATRHARAVVYDRALRGVILGALVLLLAFYVVPALEIGSGIFLVAIALSALVVPAWRMIYNEVTEGRAFCGARSSSGAARWRTSSPGPRGPAGPGLKLVGMLARDRSQVDRAAGVIGTYRDLSQVVATERIEFVLVAYPDRRGTLPVEQLLEVKFRGVEVAEGVTFYERETGKIFVRELKPSQLIFAEGSPSGPPRAA